MTNRAEKGLKTSKPGKCDLKQKNDQASLVNEKYQKINIALEDEIIELKDQLEKHQYYVESASDWFWEIDEEFRFIYVSYNHLLEEKNIQIPYGKTRWDHHFGKNAKLSKKWLDHIALLKRHEDFRNFTYHYVSPEGVPGITRISGKAVFDRNGKFKGYQGIGSDVTDLIEMDRSFGFMFTYNPLPLFIFDIETDYIISANKSMVRTFEYLQSDFWEMPVLGLFSEKDYRHEMLRNLKVNKEYWAPVRLQKKSGEIFEAEVASSSLIYRDKKTRFCIVRDVTERNRNELELKLSKARYKAVYENNPSIFFSLNKELVAISVNSYGADSLKYSVDKIVDHSILQFYDVKDHSLLQTHINSCLKNPGEALSWELQKIIGNGERVWFRETGRAIYNQQQELEVLCVSENIDEIVILTRRLKHDAEHDPLTGLGNRRQILRILEDLLKNNQQQPDYHVFCYLDLDQFKIINDSSGHTAGDEVLKQISALIATRIRKVDCLARLGGDEFGILLKDCTTEQAQTICAGILKSIGSFKFTHEEKAFRIGASIGIVPFNTSDDTVLEILGNADAACFMAKEKGRNRFQLYQPNDKELLTRSSHLSMAAELHDALDENRIKLAYQSISPIQDCSNDQGLVEIFIRIQEPGGQLKRPSEFLSAIERYGLSLALDQWVLKNAISLITELEDIFDDCLVSINISGQSLGSDKLFTYIKNLLNEYQIDAGKIVIEITETAAISNLNAALKFMNQFIELGGKFALDDFGRGFTSFSQLKELPVDFVKIDGSFIQDIARDKVDFYMVEAIHNVAQLLNLKTIAEHVESERVLKTLRALGIDYVQGYHLDRPKLILTGNIC